MTAKPKILQVTTFFDPVVGGVETQVADLAEQLQASGYEVEIATTDSGRNGSRVGLANAPKTHVGIKVQRVRTWFSFSEFHKFAPGLFKLFWRSNADIFHVHGLRKPELYLALIAGKLRGKRIVVSTHNPFQDHHSLKLSILIKLHDIFVGLLLMRFVDHYFLLSSAEISILRRFGVAKRRLTVVGNAIHPDFFVEAQVDRSELLQKLSHDSGKSVAERDWDKIVLGVGRLREIKGFQHLREAVKALPKVLFVIVGGPDDYADDLIAMYRNYPNVVVSGKFYPRAELKKFYSLADVFVLPSLEEPFGLVLVEAMAQGCAALASEVGGPAEILHRSTYGFLVEPGDGLAWKVKLSEILHSPSVLKRFQMKAKERAEQYRWESILPKYTHVYNK